MLRGSDILGALRTFAETVTSKMNQLVEGEPEDQLRAPFEALIRDIGAVLGWNLVPTGESWLTNRSGRPDYAISSDGLLVGYAELKAPGTGVRFFKGHNKRQFERFSAIPNLLYTDGNEWALYRSGELVGEVVRIRGDVSTQGERAVTAQDADRLGRLLFDFLSWQPQIPFTSTRRIDLERFARMIAPLCRMVRDDVLEALADPNSPLVQLAKDWRELLFHDASDKQFADGYAQTVTFALLLGRIEGADPLNFDTARKALLVQHTLLAKTLELLTDPLVYDEMKASLDILVRVLGAVPPSVFLKPGEDPWLYFYEIFLSEYDPQLRKDVGAYYTPPEVVQAQVRLVDDLLKRRLRKVKGFADRSVVTLDPAAGTGTYLLGIIEHTLNSLAHFGLGAAPGFATDLASNLIGFEIMVGPYSVLDLRVSRAILDRGGSLPEDGLRVYLTNTLEDPYADPPRLPMILAPIAEAQRKARDVKSEIPVLVCIGNPPYDRHEKGDKKKKASTGAWVRWGYDESDPRREKYPKPILHDFIEPAVNAGYGKDVKNLYNMYVYFWRWALWKVFEQGTNGGPGIVSFITASSYLDGPGFVGMREHMRRLCDEIWIIDLGGEGRGARKDENIFNIQTPVAIAIAFRAGSGDKDTPARVRYARVDGTREEKLERLRSITDFSSLEWVDCPSGWQDPFRPAAASAYFAWPKLTDLMPWQHSGAEFKRTWPIAPDIDTLRSRWTALLANSNKSVRASLFRETRDRKIGGTYRGVFGDEDARPLADLPPDAPLPRVERYAFRSFDRMWAIVDTRIADYLRPPLWLTCGDRQVYVTSLLTSTLGIGPALVATAHVPDRHHFSGRGGKDVIPLYRDPDARTPNIIPGLLALLESIYEVPVSAEDFLAYIYAVLAHPAYTARFYRQLESREVRVPLTRHKELFERARAIGSKLLWLHTYGQRYVPKDMLPGQIPQGQAQAVKPVPGDPDNYPDTFHYDEETMTLHVGAGTFHPVSREVYEFEVSGLKVVQSWLKYRMKEGAGKQSSELDRIRPQRWTAQFTVELLELLWILEATVSMYPAQDKLLDDILHGELILADELPPVPPSMREEPPIPRPTRKKQEEFAF